MIEWVECDRYDLYENLYTFGNEVTIAGKPPFMVHSISNTFVPGGQADYTWGKLYSAENPADRWVQCSRDLRSERDRIPYADFFVSMRGEPTDIKLTELLLKLYDRRLYEQCAHVYNSIDFKSIPQHFQDQYVQAGRMLRRTPQLAVKLALEAANPDANSQLFALQDKLFGSVKVLIGAIF